MRVTVGASSLSGPAREGNQDCIATQPLDGGGMLVSIADGLGGYAASAEASAKACAWMSTYLKEVSERGALTQRILKTTVQSANLHLWQLALERATALKTTLSAVVCLPDEALLAHVGDCRVRDGTLRQLTRDHSWSREMRFFSWIQRGSLAQHRSRHFLSRALGDQPLVRVDTARVELKADDRFILCSDGVWSSISAPDFAAFASKHTDDQTLAETLTREAQARGGTDDASAAVISVVSH
jgi:PPM family protein phosphatase